MTGKSAVRAGFALSVVALLASCHLRGAQVSQSPLLRFFERASGLIAYVAEDGNVAVIDQKGGRKHALTSDASQKGDSSIVYVSPTWSPDGSLLAFARFTLDAGGTVTEASLFTQGRDGRNQKRLIQGSRLQPFYLYWAPDSRRVSVLSDVLGEDQMEMGVATAGVEGDYRALDRGSPYYWDWRPDGRSVLVHTNMGGTAQPERISVLDPVGSSARSDLGVTGGFFQAPGYSPDGKNLAYASNADTTFTLHLRSLDGASDRVLATDHGGVFFSFAPNGRRLAYLAAISLQPVPQGALTVLDLAGNGKSHTLSEVPIISFFWSPDGRSIAFLTPENGDTTDDLFLQSSQLPYLRLMGYDVASGRTWLIAHFPPSRGMLAVLPYFDQYGRSATFWSPDSRSILFTAISAAGAPALFVARADGNTRPRLLVAGDYAFWSRK